MTLLLGRDPFDGYGDVRHPRLAGVPVEDIRHRNEPTRTAVLLAYVELVSLQQRFMRLDPQLPKELLSEWVGRDGAALFRQRREQWSAQAHAYWALLVEESAPR